MSGFLPDLARWALGGQPGLQEDQQQEGTAGPQLTVEEVRAQRLARMEALQRQQQLQQQEQVAATTVRDEPMGDANEKHESVPEPMDVDTGEVITTQKSVSKPTPMNIHVERGEETTAQKPVSKPTPMNIPPSPVNATAQLSPEPISPGSKKKKKKSESPSESNSITRKLQRKKELLLKKVLNVSLAGGSATGGDVIDLDGSTEITVQTVAEILVARLASLKSDIMAYLSQSHRRASEELKTLQQQNQPAKNTNNKTNNKTDEMGDILQEIQRQVVSYAASCIMVPGLFPAATDAVLQLANCLLVSDPSLSITFGVSGTATSSFYYLLCEELLTQDEEAFTSMMEQLIDCLCYDKLAKCKSVLDDSGAVLLVSALANACLHKRAAEVVSSSPKFLLPAAGTPDAAQQIRPQLPSNLFQIFGADHPYRPYLRRSGVGLEKDTLLGVVLRLGLPRTNPAFNATSVLRQSLDMVNRTNQTQRQYLKTYYDACHQLLKALLKAGEVTRNAVMVWFRDALLVNKGAAALQPDVTKVSSSNLLLNMQVQLLKLCEPFIDNPSKHSLIDPGFVSSPEDHGGVFAVTGDDAVSRLGEAPAASTFVYNPRNKFIPACFFFCAHSLHLGISPLLRYHENLLRHISHAHWELTTNGRDMATDPNFSFLISKQRSMEVFLFQEEVVADTLRFVNLLAGVLTGLDERNLASMPEDFVADACHILLSIAKIKGKMLRDITFAHVFQMVVKLLSSKYATIIRNYNLRAKLGDVLYELYLPPTGNDRRDVPISVGTASDGRTFLLSDPYAQETLAPSLLLLYGEVEHTGYYDKMSHRAKIASLIKFLWESSEHRPAFRRITQNKDSFIKFANGIMNETNTLIATVMQKLPEIRNAQEQMKNSAEWGRLSEEEQSQVTSRLDDNEREVKHALPLCNKTLQMFGYLNTDPEIRSLFLLEELCPRLVGMLLHVLTKLVGSRGLELKVDNPDQYEFRPKEMLRDLCAIFSLFATQPYFQTECARAGCEPALLRSALKTCRRLNLLTGESLESFASLPDSVEEAHRLVNQDEALTADAPDEFLDEILSTFMKDPVLLPSGHYVDRSTITQHLLNDPIDPFSREAMTVDDIKPAVELKARMEEWLEEKRREQLGQHSI